MRIWRSYDLSYLAPNVIFLIFVIFLSYFANFHNFPQKNEKFRVFWLFFVQNIWLDFTKIEASRLTLRETFEIMESAHKNIGEIPVSAIETDCCSKWSPIKPISYALYGIFCVFSMSYFTFLMSYFAILNVIKRTYLV